VRYLAPLFVAFCLAAAQPQEKKKDPPPIDMSPMDFKVGVVGFLRHSFGNDWKFDVVSVVNEKSAVFRLSGQPNLPFLARTPTKGMADGQKTTLPGCWRVVETAKVQGRTMFVLEEANK
jgi:hypothetical protein